MGASKTIAGAGRVVPLNATALDLLTTWACRFPDRLPDLVVEDCSGATVRGEPVIAFRVRDPEASKKWIWAYTKNDAVEKARALAQERNVSVWFEPLGAGPPLEPIKSYRA